MIEPVLLNAQNQQSRLIENFDSFIWTERFTGVGDFQMVTGHVEEALNMLPDGAHISLRDSNAVMVVERHTIERKKNSPAKLTITGRTFDSVLDRRVAIGSLTQGTAEWSMNVRTPSDAAWLVLYEICVDGRVSADDIFPPSEVGFIYPADFNTSTGPVKRYSITRGSLLSVVWSLLQTDTREDIATSPVTPAHAPRAIRSRRPTPGNTAIGLEIYKGIDRSGTVYFDATRELLDDGNYVFSKQGYANVAYVVGGTINTVLKKTPTMPLGLDRRVTLVDASQTTVTDPDILRGLGEQGLSAARELALFDGSINQDIIPYKFGVDYGLGDIVKLVGDYGLSERARVTEFIRSQDQNGYKAYPTLITIPTEE